jgi:hypothetical protein
MNHKVSRIRQLNFSRRNWYPTSDEAEVTLKICCYAESGLRRCRTALPERMPLSVEQRQLCGTAAAGCAVRRLLSHVQVTRLEGFEDKLSIPGRLLPAERGSSANPEVIRTSATAPLQILNGATSKFPAEPAQAPSVTDSKSTARINKSEISCG